MAVWWVLLKIFGPSLVPLMDEKQWLLGPDPVTEKDKHIYWGLRGALHWCSYLSLDPSFARHCGEEALAEYARRCGLTLQKQENSDSSSRKQAEEPPAEDMEVANQETV